MDTLCKLDERAENDKFEEAVASAMEVCRTLSPNERFTFIKTPTNNFMLVTNVLPGMRTNIQEVEINSAQTSTSLPSTECFSPLHVYPSRPIYDCGTHSFFCDTYSVYTRKEISLCISLNKAKHVKNMLAFVNTPGILEHASVSRPDILLWFLFASPLGFCERPNCLGYSIKGIWRPAPVLLSSYLYKSEVDLNTYFQIAEVYAYAWCKESDFEWTSDCFFPQKDIESMCLELKTRYEEKCVPFFAAHSRICFFCALYLQNRLCLDSGKREESKIPLAPIIINDCVFNECYASTDVSVVAGHHTPGSDAVKLYPVYDLSKIINSIKVVGEGIFEL